MNINDLSTERKRGKKSSAQIFGCFLLIDPFAVVTTYFWSLNSTTTRYSVRLSRNCKSIIGASESKCVMRKVYFFLSKKKSYSIVHSSPSVFCNRNSSMNASKNFIIFAALKWEKKLLCCMLCTTLFSSIHDGCMLMNFKVQHFRFAPECWRRRRHPSDRFVENE